MYFRLLKSSWILIDIASNLTVKKGQNMFILGQITLRIDPLLMQLKINKVCRLFNTDKL